MLRRLTAAAVLACAFVGAPFVVQRAQAVPGTQTTVVNSAIDSGTGCTSRVTYKPFTQWGDSNPYYLVNGGSFEGWSSSWFGSGVYRSFENEPWKVGGWSDTQSAVLTTKGATLSAPSMCVTASEPTLRFFYKSPGVPGATLQVSMRTSSWAGSATRVVTLDGSTPGWKVSPALTIQNTTDFTGTQFLYLDFISGGGSWSIDDVYVDPWKYSIY